MTIGELRAAISEAEREIIDCNIEECSIDILDIPFFGSRVRITEPNGVIHSREYECMSCEK